MSAGEIKKIIDNLGNPANAKIAQKFFKTNKGEYGFGDVFIGVRVPSLRKIAARFKDLSLKEISKLLRSEIHEHRFVALVILINQFKKASATTQKVLFDFYLKHKKQVNNWDLVDVSAPNIVGVYLLNRNKSILYKLAESNNIWDRRIAIVATQAFIRNKRINDTLAIAKILLNDQHDLIHKATGWMLREAYKQKKDQTEQFIRSQAALMPRTMLRYAIEKLPAAKRLKYLKIKLN